MDLTSVGVTNRYVTAKTIPKQRGWRTAMLGSLFRVFQLYNRRLNGKGYFIFAMFDTFNLNDICTIWFEVTLSRRLRSLDFRGIAWHRQTTCINSAD